jgi:hypothetical protein
VTQEPMTGPNPPPVFPLMWASDASANHLRGPAEMRALIEAAGFREMAWEGVTPVRPATGGPPPAHTVQGLVMGAERVDEIMRASQQNEREGRIVMIHAVFSAED